ncbi:MAG TPA: cytochrome c biogenesis protein ResB, partial [Egibacteraceae bacterium]|nr:cytochrome c biogenesis protein ResB [Egibacteraceae bacterium]
MTMAPDRPPSVASRLPDIPGPGETALRLWRRLRKMSTALVLLFLLAAASVLATFIPQRPLIPSTVADWLAGEAGPGAGVAQVLDWLGLFDVFGATWFAALVLLLFTSLTGCLLPRWRGFLRVVRKAPPAGRNLGRLTHSEQWRTALPPERALEAAAGALRGYRRRRCADATASGAAQVAAERGHWREGGSLVFHTAFYLLLAGAVIGKAFGFEGQINVPEGDAFADTRIMYDLAEPGRFFGLDDHRGFVVELTDFDVSYFANYTPKDFVSRVRILEDGQEVRRGVTRVNHPLHHDGMKLYQVRFGMAPLVVVRAGGTTLVEEAVMLSDAGGGVWTGALKVSLGATAGERDGPQIALDLVFLPDAAVTEEG